MARTATTTIGQLTEKLTIQENDHEPISVISLTRVNAIVTAVTATPHGYVTGDFVTVNGAVPAGYNGAWKVTVIGPSAFTYSGTVIGTLATPATGVITATYKSDAQGSPKQGWGTLASAPNGIWAELVTLSGLERLQAQALSARIDYRFRTRVRTDVTARMRAVWTPSWPPNALPHTLEIHSVIPDGDGRTWMLIEAGEVL